MTALPTIGGDRDTWGTKLVAWLESFANADGSLKSAPIQTALGGSQSPLDWAILDDTFRGGVSSAEPANLAFAPGLFRGFGGIKFERNGVSYYIYPKESGPLESGPGQYASIVYVSSSNGWATVSAETVILAEAGVDLRGLSGGVTPAGRVVIFYGRYNPDTTTWLSLEVIYSDDTLATWSAPYAIPHGSETSFLSGTGNLQVLENGRLLLSWYGWHGSQYTTYVITSDDNGATWSASISVVTSGTEHYTESSFVALGNGVIVGLVRGEAGSATAATTFTQVLSLDGGTSWTNQGLTTFDTWTTPPGPPYLVLLWQGRLQMVACYYVNRQTGIRMLRGVYALATDLVTNGVAAWQRRHDIKAVTSSASGYITVDQPFGVVDRRALGIYSDAGVLKFFLDGVTWPTYTAYTPAWTASGTAPAIGNAVVTARYVQIGEMVHAYGSITFGSSSTYGTGSYLFALPVTASASAFTVLSIGSADIYDASATALGRARVSAGSVTTMRLSLGATYLGVNTLIGQTAPWTWAVGDIIYWSIIYEAA